MSRIPIPFIGGGGGLKRTTAFDTRFPAPFHPETESAEEASGEEPGLYGLETAAQTLPDLAVDEEPARAPSHVTSAPWAAAAAADEAFIAAGELEAGDLSAEDEELAGADVEERASWDEEPGPGQALLGMAEAESPDLTQVTDRTPLEFAADVWGEDVGIPGVTGYEPSVQDDRAPEPEIASRLEGVEPEGEPARGGGPSEPAYLAPAASKPEAGSEDFELPDFLRILDADREGGEEYGEPGAVEAAPRRSDLSDLAADLLAGEHGKSMRTLMDRLRGEDVDSAIARAFAAGYLAAREGQGE